MAGPPTPLAGSVEIVARLGASRVECAGCEWQPVQRDRPVAEVIRHVAETSHRVAVTRPQVSTYAPRHPR